jgi:hypothetical protein
MDFAALLREAKARPEKPEALKVLQAKDASAATLRLETRISGRDHDFFLWPTRISLGNPPARLVLASLRPSEVTAADAANVSPVFIPSAVLLVTGALLMLWPTLKLHLLSPTERLTRSSLAGLVLVGLGGLVIFVVLFHGVGFELNLRGRTRARLEQIAQKLRANFEREIEDIHGLLSRQGPALRIGLRTFDEVGAPAPEAFAPYPHFSHLFGLEKPEGEGYRQIWKISAAEFPTPLVSIRSVGEFRNWNGRRLAILPLHSPNTGEFLTLVTSEPNLAGLSTRLRCFDNPVIEPGYQFAVIDPSGRILYHSDAGRALRGRLMPGGPPVLDAEGGEIRFENEGKEVRGFQTKLSPYLDWRIVTFRELGLNSQIVLETGAGAAMAFGALLALGVAFGVARRIAEMFRQPPRAGTAGQRIWPRRDAAARNRYLREAVYWFGGFTLIFWAGLPVWPGLARPMVWSVMLAAMATAAAGARWGRLPDSWNQRARQIPLSALYAARWAALLILAVSGGSLILAHGSIAARETAYQAAVERTLRVPEPDLSYRVVDGPAGFVRELQAEPWSPLPRSSRPGELFIFAGAGCVLIGGAFLWLKGICDRLFLLEQRILDPRPAARITTEQLESLIRTPGVPRRVMVLALPQSGTSQMLRRMAAESPTPIRLMDCARGPAGLSDGAALCIDNLEDRFGEAKIRTGRLETLEREVFGRGATQIFVFTSLDPLLYAEAEAAAGSGPEARNELIRWTRLMAGFEQYEWMAPQQDGLVELRKQLREQAGEHFDELLAIFNRELDRTIFLRAAAEGVMADFPWDEAVTPYSFERFLVQRVSERAAHYYRSIWVNTTAAERLALFQLAADNWINPGNRNALRHLVRKGLIQVDSEAGVPVGGYELLNESFRQFVLSAVDPAEIAQWEEARQGSRWSSFRLALLTMLGLVSIWLWYVYQQYFNFFAGYLVAAAGGSAAILRWVWDQFRRGVDPAAAKAEKK